MDSNPLVGVVIINFHCAPLTRTAVESIQFSAHPNVEIYVIDNSSPFAPDEHLANLIPGIPIHHSDHNLGFAEGCNVGIRHFVDRGAAFVLMLNADAVAEPQAIPAMLAVTQADPKIGVVGAHLRMESDRAQTESLGASINLDTGRMLHRGHGGVRLEPGAAPIETDAVSGAAMLLRMEMLDQIGEFNRGYFAYFEDVDLCLRAREKGWRIVTAPAAVVYHHGSASSGGRQSTTRLYYSTRNHLRLVEEHRPFKRWPRRFLRRGFILSLMFAYVARQKGMPKRDALRQIRSGLKDFLSNRDGSKEEAKGKI